MPELYEELDRVLTRMADSGEGYVFVGDDGAGTAMTVGLRRGQADDGTHTIRLLVDGQDLLYADEDGAMGIYEHPFSWVAKHGKG